MVKEERSITFFPLFIPPLPFPSSFLLYLSLHLPCAGLEHVRVPLLAIRRPIIIPSIIFPRLARTERALIPKPR